MSCWKIDNGFACDRFSLWYCLAKVSREEDVSWANFFCERMFLLKIDLI
jgi:hypothetical protein